jgi:DNA-binding MarR family transcriptional regulator
MKLDLDRYVPGLLLWISNRLTSTASQLYRTRFGIGVTEWRVLSYFQIYPWSTASSACELMGLDKAAVSRSVATLCTGGYLDSRPEGLRRIEYTLTAKGRALHDRIILAALAREKALLDGFSEEERAMLVQMLHRMLANIPSLRLAGEEQVDAARSSKRRKQS